MTPRGFSEVSCRRTRREEILEKEVPERVIITCARTGENIFREKSPNSPYTPEEIAQSGIEAMLWEPAGFIPMQDTLKQGVIANNRKNARLKAMLW